MPKSIPSILLIVVVGFWFDFPPLSGVSSFTLLFCKSRANFLKYLYLLIINSIKSTRLSLWDKLPHILCDILPQIYHFAAGINPFISPSGRFGAPARTF